MTNKKKKKHMVWRLPLALKVMGDLPENMSVVRGIPVEDGNEVP